MLQVTEMQADLANLTVQVTVTRTFRCTGVGLGPASGNQGPSKHRQSVSSEPDKLRYLLLGAILDTLVAMTTHSKQTPARRRVRCFSQVQALTNMVQDVLNIVSHWERRWS
jgi:hypothetical protein